MPEHWALESHWTQALFEQCGFAVGQSVSAMHCTHPGGFVIPQSTWPAPPSPPAPLLEASSLAAPPELPLAVPLELPPLEPPLEEPLDEPLSDEPLDEPEPPPSGLGPALSPPQPTPTATAAAIPIPRYVLSNDMAGLTSRSELPWKRQRRRLTTTRAPGN